MQASFAINNNVYTNETIMISQLTKNNEKITIASSPIKPPKAARRQLKRNNNTDKTSIL